MRWPRSFGEANHRRIDLIEKEMAEGLSVEEKREWVLLDTLVGAWMDYKHPFREEALEELEAMVARLEQGRQAKPREETT